MSLSSAEFVNSQRGIAVMPSVPKKEHYMANSVDPDQTPLSFRKEITIKHGNVIDLAKNKND